MFLRSLALVAFLVLVVTLSSAPLPFPPKKTKADLKAIQGNWKGVIWIRWVRTRSGETTPEHLVAQTVNLVIEGDRLKLYRDEEVLVDSAFRLDSSKKPWSIDFNRLNAGAGRGGEGIYRLEADALMLSFNPG